MIISSVDVLPREIWTIIGLHLRPRHLVKLMLTCKTINMAVNNEMYWTRVAAHLQWRSCEFMNTSSSQLYFMNGLQCGYYAGMNHFLDYLEDVIQDKFPKYQTLDLRMLVVTRFKDVLAELGDSMQEDDDEITMKTFTMRLLHFIYQFVPPNEKMIDFVNDLEDSQIPYKFKREIMTKLRDLLCGLHPKTCLSDLANGICHFT